MLAKIGVDYADEFDVQGFIITTKDIWKEKVDAAKAKLASGSHYELYFGTNEAIEFNYPKDFDRGVDEILTLTDEQAQVMFDLFGDEGNTTYCYYGNGGSVYTSLFERAKGKEKE